MTYQWVFDKSNMMGATIVAGTTYPSRTHVFTARFLVVFLLFLLYFSVSLFVAFFSLRILMNTLVSIYKPFFWINRLHYEFFGHAWLSCLNFLLIYIFVCLLEHWHLCIWKFHEGYNALSRRSNHLSAWSNSCAFVIIFAKTFSTSMQFCIIGLLRNIFFLNEYFCFRKPNYTEWIAGESRPY